MDYESRTSRKVKIFNNRYVEITELEDYLDVIKAALQSKYPFADSEIVYVNKYLQVSYGTTQVVQELLRGMYYKTYFSLVKYVKLGMEYGIPYTKFNYDIVRLTVSNLYTSDKNPWYIDPSLFINMLTVADPAEKIKSEIISLQNELEPFYFAILKRMTDRSSLEVGDLSNLPEELKVLDTLEGRLLLSIFSDTLIRLLPEDEKIIFSSHSQDNFFKENYLDLLRKDKLFKEIVSSGPNLTEEIVNKLYNIYRRFKGLRLEKAGE